MPRRVGAVAPLPVKGVGGSHHVSDVKKGKRKERGREKKNEEKKEKKRKKIIFHPKSCVRKYTHDGQ